MEATAARVLALGEAGSGKTTTALWAGREQLLRDPAGASRVLFATFSRTAVGQIARRAGPVFDGLERRFEVQTFHSLAYRLLRAFGRYGGHGRATPGIETEARAKLLGGAGELLSYADLLPAALAILEGERVRQIVCSRWSLIVCDEFQDTSTDQWEFLQLIGESSRLLLLADPHQMIYTFIPTVSATRLGEAREQSDLVVELEAASHRDPSGVIPAMARAVRQRRWQDEAVTAAVEAGRLRVVSSDDEDVPDLLAAEIKRLRRDGAKTIGVFETTNVGAAALGAELTQRGIEHTLVGLPEAHGQALEAMATIVGCGAETLTFDDVRTHLALFLTAATRSRDAPELARQLHSGVIRGASFRGNVDALQAAIAEAEDADALVAVACGAWEGLAVTTGRATWHRAAATFAAIARRELGVAGRSRAESLAALTSGASRAHVESLVGEQPVYGSVQVMNCHQTKGREADAVVVVYREGGWVTSYRDAEPFTSASRVLYVALTRARDAVTIMLPRNPHPLVAPFARFE